MRETEVPDGHGTPGRGGIRADRASHFVTPSVRWKRAEAVLFRQVLDDVVILAPGPEPEPLALTGGAALWRLLAQPRTTHQLLSTLTSGRDVDTPAEAELDGLLERLADMRAVDRLAD